MIICSCHGTTEHEFRKALHDQERRKRCPAGTGCGGCWMTLRQIANEERGRGQAQHQVAGKPAQHAIRV